MYRRTLESEVARRAAVLAYVTALTWAGRSITSAVALAAANFGVSPRTIWNWRSHVRGVGQSERLPYLVPLSARRREIQDFRITPISNARASHVQR